MVQEMARKTANKMADQAVIDPQKIHIFAYGLELLYSSLAGVSVRLFLLHRHRGGCLRLRA